MMYNTVNMTTLKLTNHATKKDIVVNWNQVQFVADTETSLGDSYCEIAFEAGNALPVNETAAEIETLLKAVE